MILFFRSIPIAQSACIVHCTVPTEILSRAQNKKRSKLPHNVEVSLRYPSFKKISFLFCFNLHGLFKTNGLEKLLIQIKS